MKKVYEKPVIVFENFSLSTNIAAGCGITDPEDPSLYVPGIGFAFTIGCDYDVTGGAGGDGDYNGICYHVMTSNGPTGGGSLHES